MTKEVVKYTEEDKLLAVEAFFLTQSSKKASDLLEDQHGKNIPASTIRRWKMNKVDWDANLALVKDHYNKKLDSTMCAILETASQNLLKAVTYGEKKMTPQGVIVTLPVPTDTLIRALKQAGDMRAQMSGGEEENKGFTLDDLQKTFVAAAMKAKQKDDRVLDTDLTEKTVDGNKE